MKTKLFLILLLALPIQSMAQKKTFREKTKEVISAVSTEVSEAFGNYRREFSTGFSGAEFTSGNDTTTISAKGSNLWEIKDQIQAGAELEFASYSSKGSSYSYFNIVGIGAYNFSSSTSRSMYAKGGFGVYAVPDSVTKKYVSKVGFFVGGGKRFPLFDRVSFSPELRIVKKGDYDPEIVVEALNFSMFY